jgi:hypothetical protein
LGCAIKGKPGFGRMVGDFRREPTDYMTATRELRNTADVLAAFAAQWSGAAEAMSRGEYAGIGKPENVAELAPLLATRAMMLQELSEQVRAEEGEG